MDQIWLPGDTAAMHSRSAIPDKHLVPLLSQRDSVVVGRFTRNSLIEGPHFALCGGAARRTQRKEISADPPSKKATKSSVWVRRGQE